MDFISGKMERAVEFFDPSCAYEPELLEWFLDAGVDPMTRNPKTEECHLRAYISENPIPQWRESMSLLIERKADVNDMMGNMKRKPLAAACQRGTTEQVKFLLDHKAIVERFDGSESIPLSLACQFGTTDMVRMLLDANANPRITNDWKATPLMLACSNRNAWHELIPLLMERDPDLHAQDKSNRTALHWASEWGSPVFAMMQVYYSAMSTRPFRQWTIKPSCADPWKVMLDAIASGHISLLQTSIDVHLTMSHAKKLWWKTRLGWPQTVFKVQDLALSGPADWRTVVINQGEARLNDEAHSTWLHYAVKQCSVTFIHYIIESKRISPYLIDRRGKRAIDLVTRSNNPKIWGLLWNYMQFQPTPFHMAWHGPYFRDKLFTFLLVLQRLQVPMPRDVVVLIFQPIAFAQDY